MTTAGDDPDREHQSQAAGAPGPAAKAPTRLQQAAAGMTEAQAWKGVQIAKGWHKLSDTLRRWKERGGSDWEHPRDA